MDRMTYRKFAKSGLSLAAVGAEPDIGRKGYFCTPDGARIFGWAGVDGIHYCFVKDLDDMVFVVDPAAERGNQVHPVAESFGDFLRLLLAVKDAGFLETAHAMTAERFGETIRNYEPTDEGKALLSELSARFGLTPMEDAHAYLSRLDAAFDFSRLRFSDPEAYPEEIPPREWKVTFDGGFRGDADRKAAAGEEIRIAQTIPWNGGQLTVPAYYRTNKGFVVDLVIEPDEWALYSFRAKWGIADDGTLSRRLTGAEEEQCRAENPLSRSVTGTLTADGVQLRMGCGWGAYRVPGEMEDEDARLAAEHYGLPAEGVLRLVRMTFRYTKKTPPESLTLTLWEEPVPAVVGEIRSKPGSTAVFVHPETGVTHTLTVLSVRPVTVPVPSRLPSHGLELRYTVEPALPAGAVRLRDSAASDAPKPSGGDDFSSVIGIIGGADGPTMVLAAPTERPDEPGQAALSSLHFEPVGQAVFSVVCRSKGASAVISLS